jgi:rSAM/selenodomain-associated transferase 2
VIDAMLQQRDAPEPRGTRSSNRTLRGARPRSLSIIVPVLNEAATIEACLQRLAPLRQRGVEVIVVDGGSADDTVALAKPLCNTLARSTRGRALQMNAGARIASGDALLFLHADTELPANADELILDALHAHPSRVWGRFDVLISGRAPLLRLVAQLICLRSRLTGIATGDQAIFCDRQAFAQASGFPEIPLMEDVAFCKRLRRHCPPLCLNEKVITSGRRWEAHGVLATIVLMWWLRFAYAIGVPPTTLSRWYRYTKGKPPSDDRHTFPT